MVRIGFKSERQSQVIKQEIFIYSKEISRIKLDTDGNTERLVEFYEGAEEILAGTGHNCTAFAWVFNCDRWGVIHCTFYLYLILIALNKDHLLSGLTHKYD